MNDTLVRDRRARSTAFLLGLLTLATPVLAADSRPAEPQINRQDLNDIATALSVVGSHCNADQPQACQAGADSKAVFAKIETIFEAQREKDRPKN